MLAEHKNTFGHEPGSGETVTDDQFATLMRAIGNLGTAMAEMQETVDGLKETANRLDRRMTALEREVREEVMPFLRRIDGRLGMVEARIAAFEGRMGVMEHRQAALEQAVYQPGAEGSQ